MDTALKGTLPSLQMVSQPHIIELAGPAGAGKSTLAQALNQQSDKITIGAEIAFRKIEQIPILFQSIPLVLSSLKRVAGSRRWTWDEIKFLVYLKKWDRVLEQPVERNPGIILLDHGPVFKLATLHAFGPDWLRSPSAGAWWDQLFQQWAAVLDLVVWLDAPDALLETRINGREQKHSVKGKSGQEVLDFLSCYRSSYYYILSGLAAFNGPNVISFDTSQAPLDETAEAILVACNLKPETDL